MTLSDLLRLGAFVGLNTLWGWNRNKYSSDFQIYGWLALANGGLALLFGARSNLFAVVARVPSAKLLRYHRWAGRATVIHATIHFGALGSSYVKSGQFTNVVKTLRIQVGLMAWISLTLMAITSISFIRRRRFELFYYVHALFILFVVGALIHASHAVEFIVPGLVLWIIDRFIRFAYNFRPIELVSTTRYANGLTKLKVRGLRKHSPGQLAWIQIPSASLLNWHPFTIISSPSNAAEASFAIRGLGNFTKSVQNLAAAPEEVQETKEVGGLGRQSRTIAAPKIRVDGPYGVGGTQWGIHPLTVIVAGGVGITPGISIATHIIERARKLGQQKAGLRWNLHIVWSVKSYRQMEWFEGELAQLAAIAADPSVPTNLELRIHVTGNRTTDLEVDEAAPDANQNPGDYNLREQVHQGRPDLRTYFQALRKQYPGLDAVVSACGPRSLVDSVRRAAVEDQNHGPYMGAYHVDEEVFEL